MSNDNYIVFRAAREDFEQAYRRGFWRAVSAWFSKRDNELLPYDEVRKHLAHHSEHYIGMHQIPVDRIVGSVSRYNDFDRAFLPRRTHTRGRWESIDRAHLTDIILPPIQVYKIGDVYFVRDGNHRVSVARERGQAFIDAEIIEIDVNVKIDKDTNIDQIIRELEQAEFFEQTHLKELRPDSNVRLSLPGVYDKMLEHINVHRYYLSINQQREVPYEEAVASWYDDVYLPMVEVIRELKMLDDFPGRTEADLYLWIIEHLWYLREESHSEVTLEEAAEHFKAEYSTSPEGFWTRTLRKAAKLIGAED